MITVVGSGRPRLDVANLNQGIQQGEQTGKTVQLVGHFNVGDTCNFCVKIEGPVTIVGTGDPTVAAPRPSEVTIIEGGTLGLATSIFTVLLPQNARPGAVNVSRLWFDKGHADQITVRSTNTNTTLRFSYLRATNVTPIAHRLDAIILASSVGRGVSVRGQIQIDHNYFDIPHPPVLRFVDENPVAIAFDDFSKITIVDNTFISRGEAEIEFSRNPDATVLYARNYLVMNAPPSPVARFLAGGLPGYPAAIKIAASPARQIQVLDNYVLAYGSNLGVCMLVTSPQTPEGNLTQTLIKGNTCDLVGSGMAIAGGFPFPGGSLQNAIVVDNTFRGSARWGIGFVDFIARPGIPRAFTLKNEGHDNVFSNNDMSKLITTTAALQFGPSTHDNLFVGNISRFNGKVVNRGKHNTIIIKP